MPTYLNSQECLPPFAAAPNVLPSRGHINSISSQISCPLVYDHIKSCSVCQQAVKNTCASISYGEITTIDKQTFILYGIFFLFLLIWITVMFKR